MRKITPIIAALLVSGCASIKERPGLWIAGGVVAGIAIAQQQDDAPAPYQPYCYANVRVDTGTDWVCR